MSILFKVPLEDHPRMCGEQNQLLMDQVPIPGSPPRVRGTAYWVSTHLARHGITPACAGNRPYMGRYRTPPGDHPRVCGEQGNQNGPTARAWDHPRVCGEQPGGYKIPRWLLGSPPRVRGTAV